MDNLDDYNDVKTLRNRRGVRKRCITATTQYLGAAAGTRLASIKLEEAERRLETVTKNQDSYILLQCKLIDLLQEEERVDDTRDEETDYMETTESFSEAISDLTELIAVKKHFTAVRVLIQLIKGLLKEGPALNLTQRNDAKKLRARYEALMPQRMNLISERDAISESWDSLEEQHGELKQMVNALIVEGREDTTAAVSRASSSDRIHHRMPRIEFPTFSGNPMDWAEFHQQFKACLGRAPDLAEEDKISYLRSAVKGTEGATVLAIVPGTAARYEDLIKLMERRFDQRRLVYRTHLQRIFRHKMNGHSKDEWQKLQLTVMQSLNALKQSGQFTAEHFLVAAVESVLDSDAAAAWLEHSHDSIDVPPLDKFLAFIEKEILVAPESIKTRSSQPSYQLNKRPSTKGAVLNTQKDEDCAICKSGAHPLYHCETFRGQQPNERLASVQRIRACSNCLSLYHTAKTCQSQHTCKKCDQKHNTMLHRGSHSATTVKTEPKETATAKPLVALTQPPKNKSRFMTGRARVQTTARTCTARLFFDTGAEVTLITGKLARTLRAKTLPGTVILSGIEGFTGTAPCKCVSVSLDMGQNGQYLPLEAVVVERIVQDIPSLPIPVDRQDPVFQGITLADTTFDRPGPIDMLVGLDVFDNILLPEIRKSQDRKITIYSTTLGWIVSCNPKTPVTEARVCVTAAHVLDQENDLLFKALWTVDDGPAEQSPLCKDDQQAVDHFAATHTRHEDGRYEVRLPKRENPPALGRSKDQAIRRFVSNENSLRKKDQWVTFREVVGEYHTLQHAEPVPLCDLKRSSGESYYLPMHGVAKATSTTTKLRAVFDASAKTTTGISLNDTLLPGPNLYPLLNEVIVTFRNNAIGMSADISKMFREISLHPDDRDLHRFLWRDLSGELTEWRMTRLTFGVTSSPFLATKVLQQLATDHQSQYPEASHSIMSEFYVDDCLTGAATVEKAVALRSQLNELTQEGSMTLRKWRSSSEQVMQTIPEDLRETEQTVQQIANPAQCHKALGIHWDTVADTLHVATPVLDTDSLSTKRQITSEVAKTYDVMGWFTPTILIPKALIQTLWKLEIGWDEPVPPEIAKTWLEWKSQLQLITAKAIPRFYHTQGKSIRSIQLHGFCDASKTAYACAVYIRASYSDTAVSTALVTARSRLAPIKELTIPRLELCGALLLSKVLESVGKRLHIPESDWYAWCDSMITLAWLNHDSGRLQTFVANRVNATVSIIPASQWKYVPTQDNPADVASRGITPSELVDHRLWWTGPPWLTQEPSAWPARNDFRKKTNLPELKKVVCSQARVMNCTVASTTTMLSTRFSSWKKLRRIMAWLLRIFHHLKAKRKLKELPTHPLDVTELERADQSIFKLEQSNFFAKEISALQQGGSVPTNSQLAALTPFLDAAGLLRVGGRLQRSAQAFAEQHPIILHKDAATLRPMVLWLHKSTNHSGASTLLGTISTTFYIMGARRVVRDITSKCVPCRKAHARTAVQLMGQLPPSRINPSSVFLEVGVDFAGPLTLKKGHTRKPVHIKGYICLFVCMATKAVHLEPVSNLSTSAFIDTLHRFVSRRGKPRTIHCDNGTNFIGAHNELKDIYQLLEQRGAREQIQRQLADQSITWEHIPSRAPHFGGLWESQVKATKRHLHKTFGHNTFTMEEMFTMLAGIEASLNSRPLVPLDRTPHDDMLALTPGHFLVGRPLTAIPTRQTLQPTSLTKRFDLCQRLTREFWDSWSRNYLHTLQQRHKWARPQRSLQTGDVVLVKDLEFSMNTWPLGLVTGIHPGTDGLVRAVDVRARGHIYRRPIQKLIVLLPSKEEDNS